MKRQGAARALVLLGFALLALCSPFLGIPRLTTDLMTTVCIFGIAASGLNLMFGYAGMFSLGNAVFLGIGGYSVAIATQDWGWPVAAGIALGLVLTVAVAFALALLLVRLSSHYFSVATLALALAFDALLVAAPGTGGGTGLTMVPHLDLGFIVIVGNFRWYVVSAILTAGVVVLFSWLVAGKRGRLLRLVRHDELAGEVLGVPVFWAKLLAFVVGALLTGFAGVLLYLSQGLITPDSVGTLVSVQLAMLAVIGGPGYRLGGFVGAFVILWLQALLNGFGSYELVVYGAALMAVVFYLRPGIEGALVGAWSRHGPFSRKAPLHQGLQDATDPGLADASDSRTSPAPFREEHKLGAGLEVRSAQRVFGGVVAVDDVSITVPAGTVIGLIGANGAGKSTLLNLISGVEALDGGEVLLDGRRIDGLSPARRTEMGLGRTFQVPRLVGELSVLENMVLGLEAAERPSLRRDRAAEAERFEAARASLGDVGLGMLADRPAASLGTGERKYVEVARAVFSRASVLLLDEPAVGLSPEEITQLQRWLQTMREQGTALLVVDHNMDFMSGVATYVYSMENGRVTWEGGPEGLEVVSVLERAGVRPEPGDSVCGSADVLA